MMKNQNHQTDSDAPIDLLLLSNRSELNLWFSIFFHLFVLYLSEFSALFATPIENLNPSA